MKTDFVIPRKDTSMATTRSKRIQLPVSETNTELAKKYWWFCGHPNAVIFSVRTQQHSCPDCPSARPKDGEIYFKGGCLRTGD